MQFVVRTQQAYLIISILRGNVCSLMGRLLSKFGSFVVTCAMVQTSVLYGANFCANMVDFYAMYAGRVDTVVRKNWVYLTHLISIFCPMKYPH